MVRDRTHMKEWLTVKEAAAALDRNSSNIYRWIKTGLLAGEIGEDRLLRVHKDALLATEAQCIRYGSTYQRVDLRRE
jgi:hypothetical protein